MENLRRLAECIEAQTTRPDKWVIVDNGSTDETVETARRLEERLDWVDVVLAPGTERAEPGQPIVRAFHAGLERIADSPDVVVKLDSDVSMGPDYFDALMQAFAAEPRLGIASGVCYEHDGEEWQPTHVTESHVRGATRAYRRECLEQVLPLEERVGWDGIDELKANVLGWQTRVVKELAFYHHRGLGSRDGAQSARWRRQGEAAYYMDYSLPYLVLRTLHHARRKPAALAMLYGYLSSWMRREPQVQDDRVKRALRQRQRLRHLRARRSEALGREQR